MHSRNRPVIGWGLGAAPQPGASNPTFTDLLVFALARALVDVPDLNGLRQADGSVVRGSAVHSRPESSRGAGLGLPLARRLARAASGDVELGRSDTGAMFVVRLPSG